MTEFLLFLIVFAITYNCGTARPVTDSDIKFIIQNRISSDDNANLGEIFNLPTVIKPGYTIAIKGRLKSMDDLFKVILRGDQDTNDYCKIIFDFGSEIIEVASAKESEAEQYVLGGKKGETFSLHIKARSNEIIVVDFEVNQLGVSSPLYCDIGNIRTIKYIEVQQGVAHTDSLKFQLFK